jgi:adenylylsulfate kinase-like enzyme
VTLLDGDIVRKHLSPELGFSREHRKAEHRAHRLRGLRDHEERGDRALAQPIAPCDAMRKQVRAMIEPHGGFLLVHVAIVSEEGNVEAAVAAAGATYWLVDPLDGTKEFVKGLPGPPA